MIAQFVFLVVMVSYSPVTSAAKYRQLENWCNPELSNGIEVEGVVCFDEDHETLYVVIAILYTWSFLHNNLLTNLRLITRVESPEDWLWDKCCWKAFNCLICKFGASIRLTGFQYCCNGQVFSWGGLLKHVFVLMPLSGYAIYTYSGVAKTV